MRPSRPPPQQPGAYQTPTPPPQQFASSAQTPSLQDQHGAYGLHGLATPMGTVDDRGSSNGILL
ncbi:MAG: hypothetical protein AAFN30_21170, partial [Actinomycetota bacterium]